jgi:hypothetical protein
MTASGLGFARWSLPQKMLAVLLVASTGPLLTVAWVESGRARRVVEDEAVALLEARADELAGDLDQFHEDFVRAAERLAGMPAVRSLAEGRTEEIAHVASAFEVFRRTDARIRGVALLDRSGTVPVATEAPLVGRSYPFRRYFQEVMAGAPRSISDIYIAVPEVASVPSIAYAVPVEGADGRAAAAVAVYVRAEAFWGVVRAADERAGRGSYSVLYDGEGIRIAHSSDPGAIFRPGGRLAPEVVERLVAERRFGEATRALLEQPIEAPEQFAAARLAGTSGGALRASEPGRKGDVGVARRLRRVSWTLFFFVPEDSIAGPVRRLVGETMLASGAIAVAALALGAYLARRTLRPIEHLTRATEALARGEQGVRAPVETGDELAALAARFNAMAGTIEQARGELEAKVAARTAALSAANIELEAQARELKAQQEELARARDELDRFFDLSAGLLCLAGMDGRFRRVNPAWQALLGWPLEELLERPWLDFVHPDDRTATVAAGEKLARGEEVKGFENRYQCKDGSYRWLLWSAAPSPERGMIYASAMDVTAQHFAREEVERADRLKSEFLANMSHELRTPLNAVIGFADLLLEEARGELGARHVRYVEDILASGRHLLTLINDILDLAKLEAGRVVLAPEPVDPEGAVAAAVAALEPQARRKKIALRTAIRASGPVLADPAKLRQVLLNLLSNAVKFSPEGAPIDIDVEDAGPDVRFVIRDRGPGIEPALRASLFKPFVQGEGPLVKSHQGTGLGLAISKRLIEQHGGSIDVTSAPGLGATFTFTIPAAGPGAAADGGPRARDAEPAAEAAAGRPCVLIVEDDVRSRQLLRAWLRADYEVIEASGRDEALEAIGRREVAVVLLDLRLGNGEDGLALLEELKRRGETAAIPVVIQSVLPDRQRGLALGAADYFVKPLDRRALVARLRELCAPPPPPAPGPLVLAIDDDPAVAALLRSIVEPAGYRFAATTSGVAGLAAARREPPGVAVVDLLLPDLSGFDVIEALAASPETREVPVIVLTGQDVSEEDRRRLRRHVVALAEKGDITRDDVLSAIDRATRRRGAAGLSAAGPTIVLADDHDLNRQLARDVLERIGFRVVEARDGAEAVEAARRERPAAAVLDIAMPGMDGLAAARALRADERTAGIPLVALTALAMRRDEERVREAGFDAYLAKPIDRRALEETLRRLTARPPAKEEVARAGGMPDMDL